MNYIKKKKDNKRSRAIAASLVMTLLFAESSFAAPSNMLVFQSIPTWEKHLSVYDKQGNLVYAPSKTTFATEDTSHPAPEYIPNMHSEPAVLGQEILIKCHLNTPEKQKWFSGITAVKMYDTDFNREFTLNHQLNEDQGIIKIYPSRVIDNNRRYQIKLESRSYDTVFTEIEIVSKETPRLLLSMPTTPKMGEDIPFRLENFNYGFKNPIQKVELIRYEKGQQVSKKELLSLKDKEKDFEYALIGNLFRIYSIAIEKPASYKVIVFAEGFKPFTVMFEVAENPALSGRGAAGGFAESAPVDVVSRATSGGGGNSGGEGGGGGGPLTQGHVLFDNDLLVNALILDEIGKATRESKKITDRWNYDITTVEAASDKNFASVKNFLNYRHAVMQAKLSEGRYLSFEDYLALPDTPDYKGAPRIVQQILEDGRLGTGFVFRDIKGKETPSASFIQKEFGKDLILEFADGSDFLKNLKWITLNSQSPLDTLSKYKIEGNRLILDKSVLRRGKTTVSIHSEGYKLFSLQFDLQPPTEQLHLEVIKPLLAKKSVLIKGLTSDFAQQLKSVSVNGRNILSKGAQGDVQEGTSRYYELLPQNILLLSAAIFEKEGSYSVTLEAKHYPPQTLSFEISATQPSESEEKQELAKQIAESERILREATYVQGTEKKLADALPQARTVHAKETASPQEIRQAIESLKLAREEVIEIQLRDDGQDVIADIRANSKMRQQYLSSVREILLNDKKLKISLTGEASILFSSIRISQFSLSRIETLRIVSENYSDWIYRKEADKKALREAIAEASAVSDLSKYTADSAAAFKKALEHAREVEKDSRAKQETVNLAEKNLRTAQKQLTEKSSRKPAPKILVEQDGTDIRLSVQGDHSFASHYVESIQKVEVDGENLNISFLGPVSRSGSRLRISKRNLTEIRSIRLVAKDYEDFLYDPVSDQDSSVLSLPPITVSQDGTDIRLSVGGDYSKALEYVRAVRKVEMNGKPLTMGITGPAFAHGTSVRISGTSLEKVHSIRLSAEGYKDFVYGKTADKKELDRMIEEAESFLPELSEYSEKMEADFRAALEAAQTAQKDPGISQTGVDEAVRKLKEAKEALKKVDKSTLREAIERAESKEGELDSYSPETARPFAEALAKARSEFADRNATGESVKAAADALKEATDKLAPKAPPVPDLPVMITVLEDGRDTRISIEGPYNERTKYLDAVREVHINGKVYGISTLLGKVSKSGLGLRISGTRLQEIRSLKIVADGYEDYLYSN